MAGTDSPQINLDNFDEKTAYTYEASGEFVFLKTDGFCVIKIGSGDDARKAQGRFSGTLAGSGNVIACSGKVVSEREASKLTGDFSGGIINKDTMLSKKGEVGVFFNDDKGTFAWFQGPIPPDVAEFVAEGVSTWMKDAKA